MGVVCASYEALLVILSVPLVGPLPSLATSKVITKSGSKRIFAAADVNALPSIFDLLGDCGKRAVDSGGEEGGCCSVSCSDCAAVLEEREKAEEGGGNEVKGGYPAAHREFVERIKENQGKLEEAMALLVVEALGLSGLRFVKVGAEADDQHSIESELCSSSPSDDIQQENRRAEEEEADRTFSNNFR
ncbi:uncharacterized protein MONOS_10035 [Monocercomonoides exilis]|uniref:uncharacterized protein n=1 Tax=Monocercomonoides exilis TaxID=2049356 RepID=UPI003559D049|nr:hypothetical protein MONOS_10035 [Monocercomonoides exilis]|eukprot:MONOS_10035.1-p1 / transcript=MONOS_10035.1 / gene=MONOS_10035 / organism=Monocercomonoides_exilis_PA203 / gene_product=unspecified product / transcript_product=unspecified product / location=Mono_scaffold00438:45996-46660(-) / protein_length=188 / sequence_SO=supercontig / SO=protein_coding / is_pseudo=false